jgi:hypothetical protein
VARDPGVREEALSGDDRFVDGAEREQYEDGAGRAHTDVGAASGTVWSAGCVEQGPTAGIELLLVEDRTGAARRPGDAE